MIDWLLIYKNKTNKASASEQKEYSKWLKKSFRHHRYSEKSAEYHRVNGKFTPISNDTLSAKFVKLVQEANTLESQETTFHKRKNRTTTKIIAAITSTAAVIIVSLFLLSPHISEKNIPKLTEATNISVPTLVLENGNNIALENNPNIDKERLIEKISDLKISYLNSNFHSDTINKPTFNTLIIPSRYTYTIILDDSTEIHLNANSQLHYPVKFTGDKREVFLKGEAYFKVSKGRKPFIVSTDEISVKVYGTEFTINSNNKERIETILLSGSVGVTIKHTNSDEIPMVPNQKFTLNTINKENKIETIHPENYVAAWRDGLFKCDSEELSVVLDEISQWYGVEFQYSRDEIKNISVSVKLKRTIELENIVKAIEEISGASFIKINKNKYVIE